MIPYFIFLSVVLLTLYLYKKTKNEIYFKSTFVIIFLFVAFRGNGSGDYFTYLEYSNNINSISDVLNSSFPMEIGFRLISYIKNIIRFPDQFVIVVMAFISIYLTYYFVEKFSSNKILSTIIFLPLLLQFDMHATRSAIAASAGCLTLFYSFEKKYKLSFSFFFIGLCFHRSILILTLFMIIKFFFYVFDDKKYILISCFLVIISVFISLKQLILGLSHINFFKSNIIIIKLSEYFLRDTFSYSINLFDPRVILLVCILILSLLCIYYSDTCNRQLRFFSYILLTNALITLLFKDSTFLAYRLNSFFDRNIIVILPFLLNDFENKVNVTMIRNFSFIKNFFKKKNFLISFVYLLYYGALVLMTMVPYYTCF